jgi:SAM-dependent methyltransferase
MAAVEQQRGYYDSAHLADYYESLWTDHPLLNDVDVYWRYLKSTMLSEHQGDGHFVVLDVGTGTGRVMHSLIAKARNDPTISLPMMRLIGIDPSPYMLECARNAKKLPPDVNVSWFEGSGTALQDIEPFINCSTRVNLLIFAFSGINHLHLAREIEKFFASVEKVLCPRGLALVSVCKPLLDVQGTMVPNPYGTVKEVKSKRRGSILYREWETGQKINDDIFINSLRTEVVQIGLDGTEQIIERNKHDIPLKLLTRDLLRATIAVVGLRLAQEEDLTEEVIFVIEKADS